MINTKTHIGNEMVKKQFDDLDNYNLKERFYYGIVSDCDPSKKGSSLACCNNTTSTILITNIGTTDDYIDVIVNEEYPHLYKLSAGEEWNYGNTLNETALNIKNALNKIKGIKSIVQNDQIKITVLNPNTNFRISSNNESLLVSNEVMFTLNQGTVVFKNGNALTLDEPINFKFKYPDVESNNTFRVCVCCNTVPVEYAENIFGDEEVKYTEFSPIKDNIIIEVDNNEEPNDNEICVAILRYVDGLISIIDNEGHLFVYNRPWFSPKDTSHRSDLGSSKVTINNPHGIGYNDIDSENTLHNRLMDNGIIICPPTEIQDCSGDKIEEILYASNVFIDVNNVFKRNENGYAYYYKMSYVPTQILGIYVKEGTDWKETNLLHIKNTPYLIGETNKIKDIKIIYLACKTAYSNIDSTLGVAIHELNGNDVIFSEGKSLDIFDTYKEIFHKTNINNYFIIGLNNKGEIISNPTIQINQNLNVQSDSLEGLKSKSRLKVYLYNTDSNCKLNCPSSGIKYASTEEYNLYKCNSSFIYNDGNIPFLDSLISPYNNQVEIVNETDTIPGRTELRKDYLELDISGDAYENKGIENVNVLKYREENIGNTNEYIQGQYHKIIEIPITSSNNIFKIEGYLRINNASNLLDTSVTIKAGEVILGSTSNNHYPTDCIKVSIPTNIKTDRIIIDITSPSINVYISEIKLDIVFDFINTRYYINQKEGEKEVTRLMYDPTIQYEPDVLFVENGKVYIKKTELIYNDEVDEDEHRIYYINDIFKPVKNVKTNSNFNVKVTIYGESQGEQISETLEFDSTFREQSPLNFKVSNNAFDSISKYTIDEYSTLGNILILSYPLSNFDNTCNLEYIVYEGNVVSKYVDTRLCETTIEKSIVNTGDIKEMLSTSDVVSRLRSI